jgi:hypothetical protein
MGPELSVMFHQSCLSLRLNEFELRHKQAANDFSRATSAFISVRAVHNEMKTGRGEAIDGRL